MATRNLEIQVVEHDVNITHECHVVDTTHLVLFTILGPQFGILARREEVTLEHVRADSDMSKEHLVTVGCFLLLGWRVRK